MSILHTSGLDHTGSAGLKHALGENLYTEWLGLDRLLARLKESHSICLKVLYEVPSSMDRERARGYMECLFPEVTKRGIVEVVS